MTPSGLKILFLCILAFSILMSAGCISQTKIENSTTSSLPSVTFSPPTTEPVQFQFRNDTANTSPVINFFPSETNPVQTQCPSSTNVTPWAIINPISIHFIGDLFKIEGTTNLDIDKKVILSIKEGQPNRGPSYTGQFTKDISEYIKIEGDNCGNNSWVYPINLSKEYGYYSLHNYEVSISVEQKNRPNLLLNYSNLYIRNRPHSPEDDVE